MTSAPLPLTAPIPFPALTGDQFARMSDRDLDLIARIQSDLVLPALYDRAAFDTTAWSCRPLLAVLQHRLPALAQRLRRSGQQARTRRGWDTSKASTTENRSAQ